MGLVRLTNGILSVKLPKPKNVASEYRPGGDDEVDEDGNSSSRGTVAFKLLSRDSKGRVETRQLLVPEDASMAVKQIKTEAAMKLEKQKIKEKVLQIESLAEKVSDLIPHIFIILQSVFTWTLGCA